MIETYKLTSKGWIALRLRQAGKPLATHELNIPGYSENALATRCSEMARAGLIIGNVRQGKQFKEWSLPQMETIPGL